MLNVAEDVCTNATFYSDVGIGFKHFIIEDGNNGTIAPHIDEIIEFMHDVLVKENGNIFGVFIIYD